MGEPDSLPENLHSVGVKPIIDGQIFKVEGATLVSHYTPGHTDDHMVFWLEEEEALFSADNVLGGSTTVFSDLKVYLETLNKMAKIGNGKLGKIYPGHGPVIYDGPQVIKDYISHRKAREDQILELLNGSSEPLSLSDIAAELYKDISAEASAYIERGVLLHLDKLLQENRAFKDPDSGEWTSLSRAKL
ncbi:hypothetical protein AWJ20_4059 [Sugiyamaella lignohabitans]|uniref:Metallo-beta-lactamase domain-containing protein n=1 Tax=Sugiyamaella lignohabitans TaxID=796027 RepID=A0A167C5V1_9ASCO|nr:uncharacterized protein AWJ20_4059 [Sugiyamaella lignohabitans]ANB11256.1 hypothetical protein AWJ20_4059 [Sugiyamaella lignohabitans]